MRSAMLLYPDPLRCALLLCVTLCGSPTFAGPARADAIASLAVPGRVVLAPLNLGVEAVPELEPGLEPVWAELVRRLGEQDPPPATLAREGAAALWRATLAEPTGDGETSRDVYAAYASFARRVAKQVDYGLIVIPSLVTRSAEIHGHQASWDGVQQLVETPRLTVEGSGGGDQPWIRTNGIHGALRAASLHVAVFTPEGELRFEGAGGLTLLQRVELAAGQGPEVLRVTAAPDPFADPKALREGVEAAFATPLPASHAH